ncbi:Alkaline phosphatase synthesis sensor protein PhoR [Caulifigura coniformis]|uniref:histidine kinase n=1 Tax=Caulifigura coniformis TaxID=2527983 RepID=A0A517SKL7_9PLAN|nr:HAMP domain-containing sensor histidine kinase [Caulifigura coniformis]QDT56664.1 Alkaline phosphatase synthesis sensor protein PhoR [Caulifigura coniformis]
MIAPDPATRRTVAGSRAASIGKATPLQSLRTRLAVWNAAVVILTAVTTLVILRQGVTWALLREIDEILGEDIVEIGLMLSEIPKDQFGELTHELDRKAIGHRHHGWFAELLGPQGERIWLSGGRDSGPPAPQAARSGPPADLRTIRGPAPPNQHGVKTVVVGTRLTLLRHDLSKIDELVVLTATLIFAVAPLFAYWLAGRATNAVGEITRTASRLRPDRLEERLPLRGTGDELDQLAQTINGLLDRIAVFLDHKRDVLANAAHELRTPLAAIRSSVEVALNEQRTPQEYQELLEDIIDQSGSLQTLLNQLLLLSEAEAELLRSQVDVVGLDRIVSRAVEMFQGVAEVREISLEVQPLPRCDVSGNKVHLQQVVNNLIDNGLKYTPAGGKVQVTLNVDRDRRVARLHVKDSGIGVSAVDVPRIFDRFFRVDRSRRRDSPEGTGLGLSICKAVVEAHGGKISCQSTLGQGTEFTVELQLASPPDPEADGESTDAQRAALPR